MIRKKKGSPSTNKKKRCIYLQNPKGVKKRDKNLKRKLGFAEVLAEKEKKRFLRSTKQKDTLSSVLSVSKEITLSVTVNKI